MRIVFLGDSLTWGGYGGDYVAAIKDLLPQHEIINAGVGGNTVINLLERLENDVLAHEPDGVFVMVGGNDATSYTQPKTRAYYQQVQNIPNGIVTPELFTQTYRDLLHQLQLNYIQTWVGLPPKEYNPATVAAQEQFNNLAADVARTMNIPTLDLMAHFKPETIPERNEIDMGFINQIGKRVASGWSDFDAEKARCGFTFTFDGLHFTHDAAAEAARLIADFITG